MIISPPWEYSMECGNANAMSLGVSVVGVIIKNLKQDLKLKNYLNTSQSQNLNLKNEKIKISFKAYSVKG